MAPHLLGAEEVVAAFLVMIAHCGSARSQVRVPCREPNIGVMGNPGVGVWWPPRSAVRLNSLQPSRYLEPKNSVVTGLVWLQSYVQLLIATQRVQQAPQYYADPALPAGWRYPYPDHVFQGEPMSEAMSFAELEDQTAELLPARTVLSMMSANTMNNPAPIGQPSNPAGGDHPMYDTWMNALTLLGVPHHQSPGNVQ